MNDRPDIGAQLQKAREKRDLSLSEVAHETRIPLATLQSLEKNDYTNFASPAYTKSFLNQYSEYLKIDAHEILENFDTGNVLDQSDSIEYINQDKASNTHRSAPTRRNSSPSSQTPSSNFSQPLLILFITGALIAGGIWGFIAVEKKLNAAPEKAATPTSDPSTKSEKSPTPPKDPAIVATPGPEENARPPRIISSGNPDTIASTPPANPSEDPEAPVYVFPEDTPPPRAIIVNEDEDEDEDQE